MSLIEFALKKIKKNRATSISVAIMIICLIGAIFLHQSLLRKGLFIIFSILVLNNTLKDSLKNSSSLNYSKGQLLLLYTYNLFYTIAIVIGFSTFIFPSINNQVIYRLCVVLFGFGGLTNHILLGTKNGFTKGKLLFIFLIIIAILFLSYEMFIVM